MSLVARASVFVLSMLAAVPCASASPLFELSGGGFGTGGLSARSVGPSASSTYFNPALLPHAQQGLEIGLLFLNDAISIAVDGRNPAWDVPESAVARFGEGFPSVPTSWLEGGCDPDLGGACASPIPAAPRQGQGSSGNVRLYQALGLVSHILEKRLSLGLYALVPYGGFTQAQSFLVDEREQFYTNSLHPEMYADRLTPVSLAFGAGAQLTRWMSVGLSFTLSLQNRANAVAYVGNSADLDRTLLLSTKVDVAASVSPHVSVLLEPRRDLDLSFTLHSPQQMVIDTAFGIYLPNGDLQRATRPATHAYVPWIVGVGAAYDAYAHEKLLWTLVASGTFERWSQYVNRQSERPLPEYPFHDTFSGTVGTRLTFDQQWVGFFDFGFHPTPVPAQRGRTNYVDNDRLSLALGGSYELPVPSWNVGFRFGAQTQLHVLPERYQRKAAPGAPGAVLDEWADDTVDIRTGTTIPEAQGLQTNNPGFPGFSSRGFVWGGTLSASILY